MSELVSTRVFQDLDQSISYHLSKSCDPNDSETQIHHALAVLRLAEARAWLTHPGQPHGKCK